MVNRYLIRTVDAEILGGEEFGQLLVEEIILPEVSQNGYYKLNATLTNQEGKEMATGFDDLFVVNSAIQISTDDIQVIDAFRHHSKIFNKRE